MLAAAPLLHDRTVAKRAGQRIGKHKDQRPSQGKTTQAAQGRPPPGAFLGQAQHQHADDKTSKSHKGREKQNRDQKQPP